MSDETECNKKLAKARAEAEDNLFGSHDAEITRLRAEVERRGEMLKRSHGFLIIAKSRLENLEARNTLAVCTSLMSEIESLDNAPDSPTAKAGTVPRGDGG